MAPRISRAAFDLLAGCADDPAVFFYSALRAPRLRRWQLRVCERIRRQLAAGHRHIRVLCRTCRGAGKTYLAAGLGLWFIATRAESRGLTTAPKWSAIEDYLWPEIAKLYNGSALREMGFGRLMATEFVVNEEGEGKPSWYLTGASSDRPEKLEGHHSPTAALRIVDEAKIVEHGVFVSTFGMLDAPETFDLWISTPSVKSGDFYERDAHDADPHLIRAVVTVDDLIAEGIPGKAAWKELAKTELGGESSFEYQAQAMARYIDNAEGALYPFTWIERAMLSKSFEVLAKPFFGYDVAGSVGGDENALAPIHGPDSKERYQIGKIIRWRERDTQVSKDRVIAAALETKALGVRVDVQGLGKGVLDAIRREAEIRALPFDVAEYSSSAAARAPERFANRKAEDHWRFRSLLEKDLVRLPLDPKLKEQLAAMKFEVRNGKIRIIDPSDSPDLVDAVLIGLGRREGKISAVYGWKAPRMRAF